MRIDRNTSLFFDASCLVAAAGSPTGGSGYLLSICAMGMLRAVVSQPVLLEAERNVLANFPPLALERYHRFVVLTPMTLVSFPRGKKRQIYQKTVGKKDEHVLVAAAIEKTPFLITLDKQLAQKVNQSSFPIRALSPGEFIKTILPYHADYATDR